MASEEEERIFRRGSRTYYHSSKLFPKEYRDDVFTLYAFVRVADDLVDTMPPKKESFESFKKDSLSALEGKRAGDTIIDRFAALAERKGFAKKDVVSFLDAMRSDIDPKPFKDFKDVDRYINGSAEVIGLFMARIFGLPKKLDGQAMLLGRAMQYINWLRDIKEDNELKRQYLPMSVLKEHGLSSLSYEEAKNHPEAFKELMRSEIRRYDEWQSRAEESFAQLPRSMAFAVRTASDAYRWTAKRIAKDPFVVYKKKVKPSKCRLLLFAARNKVR